MFSGTDLFNLLRGSARGREMRELRRSWDATERLWRRSAFGKGKRDDLVLGILKDVQHRIGCLPAVPVLLAAYQAIDALYGAEDIGALDAVWSVIETDIDAAVELRQMLVRRRRWLAAFRETNAAFHRIVVDNLCAYFQALPEFCFGDWGAEQGDTFEVPLLDLIDDPASIVDLLLMLPYDNESFRLDLFLSLRDLCGRNMLLASGFSPAADITAAANKLVRPQNQKGKSGAELADLYLRGSPLRALVDIPVPFRVPDELRFEHCHIVGGTGHGKTQLLQKMIHADLVASQQDGRSVVVIDSQGDLISKLVRLELFSPDVPDSLADRLVVIDPADVEFPAALNLFDAHVERVRGYSAADRERVLNGVIELYELFFGTFLGAELTQKQGVIFKYLARLMLAIPDATIHTLMRIMEDGRPYKPYMDKLDGSARYFFESEFFSPSFAATKKQVLRRLWGVLSTPAFERMFTQPKNKLDLFEAMNEGKIILISTAKDLLKRDGSQLLGRFFIAMIAQAALERSTVPENCRNPAFVYVDEAQEYFDDSIETILNQARKYRVGLTLAHQTLDQLSPRLRSGIITNTSMKCVGGVSSKDARALADELRTTPDFIECMKRRGQRSEFALWVKNLTGQAVRMSVLLGFLERQPTLAEEDYEVLVMRSRARYCGVLERTEPPRELVVTPQLAAEPAARPEPVPEVVVPNTSDPVTQTRARPTAPPQQPLEMGKGGPQHKYLQSLVKGLAEQYGLKATTEAPLAGGAGQVDVILERNGVVAAIEISVSTPVEHERENLRKCLAAGFPRIAVVLAKSRTTQARYTAALVEAVPEKDRARVAFLAPEDLPAYIASFAPPAPTEKTIRGYKVRVSSASDSPEEARERQKAVAKVIARSLGKA